MKYAIMLPPPDWSVEFNTFEEALGWIRTTGRTTPWSGVFGPNYDGPEDKTRGLTEEEDERLWAEL